MHVAACSTSPLLRDALFPLTGTVTILYLLLRQEKQTPPTTMNDVSTTFMGIYYFGCAPSRPLSAVQHRAAPCSTVQRCSSHAMVAPLDL